jgi:hypothetical protein
LRLRARCRHPSSSNLACRGPDTPVPVVLPRDRAKWRSNATSSKSARSGPMRRLCRL